MSLSSEFFFAVKVYDHGSPDVKPSKTGILVSTGVVPDARVNPVKALQTVEPTS